MTPILGARRAGNEKLHSTCSSVKQCCKKRPRIERAQERPRGATKASPAAAFACCS